MNRVIGSVLALVLLALAGCVTPTAAPVIPPMITKFDSAELEPYRGKGTAKISGQAFLKTRGGDVKVAAGEKVSVIPGTRFTLEAFALMDRYLARPAEYTAVRPEILASAREVQADAQGNFEFTDLPAGTYVVEVSITWEIPAVYGGGMQRTGGVVRKTVKVGDGEAARVMLTR